MSRITINSDTRFDRVVVVRELERKVFPSGQTQRNFLCKCDCGDLVEITWTHLYDKRRKQCRSCDLASRVEAGKQRATTHGMSNTPEYKIYHGILRRCFDSNQKCYPRYGGRGITVCNGWRNSFQTFFRDMNERPTSKHSIDRVDVNKHYSCGYCEHCLENNWTANCRWATASEQAKNKRGIQKLEIDGRSLPISEWVKITGLTKTAIHHRLKMGWSVEKTLTTPSRKKKKRWSPPE